MVLGPHLIRWTNRGTRKNHRKSRQDGIKGWKGEIRESQVMDIGKLGRWHCHQKLHCGYSPTSHFAFLCNRIACIHRQPLEHEMRNKRTFLSEQHKLVNQLLDQDKPSLLLKDICSQDRSVLQFKYRNDYISNTSNWIIMDNQFFRNIFACVIYGSLQKDPYCKCKLLCGTQLSIRKWIRSEMNIINKLSRVQAQQQGSRETDDLALC